MEVEVAVRSVIQRVNRCKFLEYSFITKSVNLMTHTQCVERRFWQDLSSGTGVWKADSTNETCRVWCCQLPNCGREVSNLFYQSSRTFISTSRKWSAVGGHDRMHPTHQDFTTQNCCHGGRADPIPKPRVVKIIFFYPRRRRDIVSPVWSAKINQNHKNFHIRGPGDTNKGRWSPEKLLPHLSFQYHLKSDVWISIQDEWLGYNMMQHGSRRGEESQTPQFQELAILLDKAAEDGVPMHRCAYWAWQCRYTQKKAVYK